jgi:hypothetical protein
VAATSAFVSLAIPESIVDGDISDAVRLPGRPRISL